MYVLLLISVAVIGIVIEKYRQLAKVKKANQNLLAALQEQSSLDSLRSTLANHPQGSPLALMLDKLFNARINDSDLISQSMESSANLELHRLEKGMGWLSTFAAVAPLIGFLGTVIGMVRVFMSIQAHSSAGVDINILAGGIWEALLTTIGGLIVGIVAIIFYNDLIQKLENLVKDMQDSGIEYMIRMRSLS
ncbi:MAG: MotA/TolQ/ExbB proton channel family protein [Candidatus Cloacimonetes bacterium]|jgi:biopolymer transport protein ExbB|nr:MotA/TolQ/ExbB proton channel family protein [Candidatus Cloacimonadota bacterium]MCK9177731.1 MotA/TolQ/ExbB proton channel family protein [Candidatus Cloacimonadota bacterium]MCK9241905.1 MotA/TolQ/ExbB proton channel family protein [Candidatus Cloacimonadota bacterium]MDD3103891.1 MotA/TolQ/ExbB proton channel family protein [Candidatus Cloacimonadota bacterium]MDD3532512.1 MotA/TolQ/ExbB proton channel family protein [Candidatus Cloacimonadota bacterium]